MPTNMIALTGTLRGIRADAAGRVAVYLVRGRDLLAQSPVGADGSVRLNLSRPAATAPSAYALEVVVGPAGLEQGLEEVPHLQRVPLDPAQLEKAETHFPLPLDRVQINDEILKIWLAWCRRYCVSGTVVAPDGCPVPGAQVTVYSVAHALGGFSRVPRATVTTDATGHFTACFTWCACRFCDCWPCWPIWWLCWPWWWEWDILHVIENIERVGPQAQVLQRGPLAAQTTSLALSRPPGRDLARGQGFAAALRTDAALTADPARTALIQRKLADPAIRAIFPWWWWCCDDPNILFRVTQGANTILDEDPATETRWCLEDGSTVMLVGNDRTVGACQGGPKPVHGFVWTRVGNVTVDHIHGGYADGVAGTDTSDLPFAGTLDIYGEFAPTSGVAYYQVNAGQWTGDPSRGGTAPVSSAPIGPELHNTVVILHTDLTVTIADVKMGPFSNAGLTDLYATQEQRPSVPGGLLPPFPTVNPGDAVLWSFNGRKVNASASALIGGGAVGGVDLTISGYDAAFAPVALPANPDDSLTLDVDDTGLTTARINSLRAFRSDGTEVTSTGTGGDCPAYQIGPGGYVRLNVTVEDANGHLFEYVVTPDFGHGTTGTTTPGLRGYSQAPGTFPPPSYQAPNTAQKSFVGGTEDVTFSPTVDCCYDFRLLVGKRVTDGVNFPGLYTADFQTATLKVT